MQYISCIIYFGRRFKGYSIKRFMKIEYTEHAKENMKERKLSRNLIENIIINPEKVIEGSFGRKIAQKIIGNKLLRVIYEQENNVYIIITAYYTKPERYR